MDIQEIIAFIIVAAAALYMIRKLFFPGAAGDNDCGSGCGHCPTAKEKTDSNRIEIPSA